MLAMRTSKAKRLASSLDFGAWLKKALYASTEQFRKISDIW